MTDTNPARELALKAGRVALGPLTSRLDHVRRDLADVQAHHAELLARMEQLDAVCRRLDAYIDRVREEVRADLETAAGERVSAATRSITDELGPTDPAEAGEALRLRFDHALLHAEALTRELGERVDRQLGEVRAGTRLTQALVERALQATPPAAEAPPGDGDRPPVAAPPASPVAGFEHPVPSFDLLYRTFEDRHRGSVEAITRRQADDYLELVGSVDHPELPIADLGCGRGELVRLLTDAGHRAVGVDSNTGQLADGADLELVEDDLFRYLDAQDDGSHRAVLSMHVVEHLPLDLQVRLVFEARRVLAEGGLLILETPNALSISTAATNFWVDPTHQRPVHPLFLEFLAEEAGFREVELRPLHPIDLHFAGRDAAPELTDDLESLLLGSGDIALLARR